MIILRCKNGGSFFGAHSAKLIKIIANSIKNQLFFVKIAQFRRFLRLPLSCLITTLAAGLLLFFLAIFINLISALWTSSKFRNW
jgi:hypothetical protein